MPENTGVDLYIGKYPPPPQLVSFGAKNVKMEEKKGENVKKEER
jgi:hypothetical protein